MKEPKSQEAIAAELKASLKKPDAKAPEAKAQDDTQKPSSDTPSDKSPAEVPGSQAPEKKEEQTPETDKAEADAKEGHRKPGAEKRINELVGELKAEKAERIQDREKLKAMEAELAALKAKSEKPAQEADKSKKISEAEKARITKYLTEDKELPREERREMTNDEVEEWIIESPVEAQEWIADRAARRREERNADLQDLDVDKEATAVIKKRDESQKKVLQKHPDLAFESRAKDLVLSGLSREEAMKQIAKENPKMKVIFEIIAEPGAQDKYAFSADGPEQLMQEMERRLEKNPALKAKGTNEDREARIAEEAAEAERQRQASVDSAARSTRGSSSGGEQSAEYKQQLAIMKSLGKTDAEAKAALDRQLARRASMNL